jgi:dihydrofolate reductase
MEPGPLGSGARTWNVSVGSGNGRPWPAAHNPGGMDVDQPQHGPANTVRGSVYIATSLDGFIAREDGAIDWLCESSDQPGEDDGYQAFFDSVDALVMGRNTYDLVRGFDAWPYGTKPVIVLTSRPLDIPDELRDRISTLSGAPTEIARRLSERGLKHVYVDGGKTIQGFLTAGLIQRMTITRVPVLIGTGIPLFGAVPHDIELRHVETRTYDNGLVQSTYDVVPRASAGA